MRGRHKRLKTASAAGRKPSYSIGPESASNHLQVSPPLDQQVRFLDPALHNVLGFDPFIYWDSCRPDWDSCHPQLSQNSIGWGLGLTQILFRGSIVSCFASFMLVTQILSHILSIRYFAWSQFSWFRRCRILTFHKARPIVQFNRCICILLAKKCAYLEIPETSASWMEPTLYIVRMLHRCTSLFTSFLI